MFFQTLQRFFLLGFLFTIALNIHAQDLIYTPVNPAYGGNTLNYGWMLNSATAQNRLTDPGSQTSLSDRRDNQLDEFTASLERQLLNQLSRDIFDQQFGEDILTQEGTYQLGNFQVDVQPGIDGLIITITDFSTGGTTNLTVPFF